MDGDFEAKCMQAVDVRATTMVMLTGWKLLQDHCKTTAGPAMWCRSFADWLARPLASSRSPEPKLARLMRTGRLFLGGPQGHIEDLARCEHCDAGTLTWPRRHERLCKGS